MGAAQVEAAIILLYFAHKDQVATMKSQVNKNVFKASAFPKPFNKEELEFAFTIILAEADRHRVVQARQILAHNPEAPVSQTLAPFLLATTGRVDEADITVLAHFLWQVKRKLWGRPVLYHIMPVFMGPQGSGKSISIKKLLAPLAELGLVLTTSVAEVADPRYFKTLSENFVAFMDEMSFAEKTDINSLKNIITAEILTPRKLGTNQNYNLVQSCSFIGGSNRHVNEMFYDTTGMRRFYQIDCLPTMDWASIGKLDSLSIWKSIDEGLDYGYNTGPQFKLVQQRQEALMNKDDVTLFLEDTRLEHTTDRKKATTSKFVYLRFVHWCNENGIKKVLTQQSLSKKLTNKGYALETRSHNNTSTRVLMAEFQTQTPEALAHVPQTVAHLTTVGEGQ
jgi:predicted P-loop ATPase